MDRNGSKAFRVPPRFPFFLNLYNVFFFIVLKKEQYEKEKNVFKSI